MKLKLTESKIPKLNIDKSDVYFVTVPSVTDIVVSLPKQISKFNDWYWTQVGSFKDPYGDNYFATAASPVGGNTSSKPADEKCQVRPVIEMGVFNTKNIPFLEDGNIISCFGYNWYVYQYDDGGTIPIVKLFCMGSIGSCQYSSNKFPCKYYNSDLSKFVEGWWKSVKDDPDHNKHFEAKIYKGKNLIDTLYSNDFKEITDMIDEEIKEGHWVEFTNKLNGKSGKLTPEDLKD